MLLFKIFLTSKVFGWRNHNNAQCLTGEITILFSMRVVNEAIKTILIFLGNAKQTICTLLEGFLRKKLLLLMFFVCLFMFCWLVLAGFPFLCILNFFVKKIEIVLISSFTILQTCTPINPPIENLFVGTYFYLCESLIIYENLFESLLIYDHLCESIFLTLL